MKHLIKQLSTYLFLTIFCINGYADGLDAKLNLVFEVFKIHPESCTKELQPIKENLLSLGEVLFNTTALSGDNDTSCATCHIEGREFTDALPVSVGVGGESKGIERMNEGSGVIVPRNSFTLRERANKKFQAYFWDGKVQNQGNNIISPLGDEAVNKFISPLAIASVLPIIARDELLGKYNFIGASQNIRVVDKEYYQDRYSAYTKILRKIISEPSNKDQMVLRDTIIETGISIDSIELSDVGNAISSFIAKNISCIDTPWKRYISGDNDAITERQKRGAYLFYGKGRCAGCHSGILMSDFKYHSISVPQDGYGPSMLGQDLGRAEVSLLAEDRFKFRTPPLILVSKTAPYGHNGHFNTLKEVVEFHINPIDYFVKNGWVNDKERINYGKILQSRDKLFSYVDINKRDEIEDLVYFLEAI